MDTGAIQWASGLRRAGFVVMLLSCSQPRWADATTATCSNHGGNSYVVDCTGGASDLGNPCVNSTLGCCKVGSCASNGQGGYYCDLNGGELYACNDDNKCTHDVCTIDGSYDVDCQHTNLGSSTSCDDDGDRCTDDVCDPELTGTCTHPPAEAGTTCSSDGNPCTDDECDGDGTCVHSNNTQNCNDSDSCTTDDHCDGGQCLGHGFAPNGHSCASDGNPCTTDACNGSGTCQHTVVAGASCADDGNPCTSDVCDGSGACTHPNASVGTSCASDGNPCTTDACDGSGTCQHTVTAGAGCASDSNPCTDDVCDGSGACTHPNNAQSCNDSNSCTTNDHCQGGTCVGGGFANSGHSCSSDGNPCTNDVCDGAGACTHPNQGAGTSCPSDGNPCTKDECNGSGTCTHSNPAPNGTSCSDGNSCTLSDTCSNGVCQSGTAKDCSATQYNLKCATGTSCNTQNGDCEPIAKANSNGAVCDDGKECTSYSECWNGECGPLGHRYEVQQANVSCWDRDYCRTPGTCANGPNCPNGGRQSIAQNQPCNFPNSTNPNACVLSATCQPVGGGMKCTASTCKGSSSTCGNCGGNPCGGNNTATDPHWPCLCSDIQQN